jgi:hypothetical protein
MTIKVTHNIPEINKFLTKIEKDIVVKALNRTVKRTVRKSKVIISNKLKKKISLNVSEIKKHIWEHRSYSKYIDKIKGKIILSGKAIGLNRFMRKSQLSKSKRFVKVRVFRNKKSIIPGGFIGKGRSGNYLPFKRIGKSRLPIKKLTGSSIASAYRVTKVNIETNENIKEYFIRTFNADFKGRMKKMR